MAFRRLSPSTPITVASLVLTLLLGAAPAGALSVEIRVPVAGVVLSIQDGGPGDLDPAPDSVRFDASAALAPLGYSVFEGTLDTSTPLATHLQDFLAPGDVLTLTDVRVEGATSVPVLISFSGELSISGAVAGGLEATVSNGSGTLSGSAVSAAGALAGLLDGAIADPFLDPLSLDLLVTGPSPQAVSGPFGPGTLPAVFGDLEVEGWLRVLPGAGDVIELPASMQVGSVVPEPGLGVVPAVVGLAAARRRRG